MRCYIYLFRHGQSTYNKSSRFTGWIDSRLTSKGVREAKKVALQLKDKKFQLAVQSKLSRSKDTLKKVLKYHPECERVITDNRIIERDYGDLSGKYHKTVIEKHGKEQYDIWHRSYNVPPPKGESIQMVERRVNEFIRDLLKTIKQYKINVAISAHGNSMRPFRRYFERLSVNQMMKLENPYDRYFQYSINV
tara:strand:- start:150 stop:725 length:576 start_codon:yes stop_codon:yes gene_type:complete